MRGIGIISWNFNHLWQITTRTYDKRGQNLSKNSSRKMHGASISFRHQALTNCREPLSSQTHTHTSNNFTRSAIWLPSLLINARKTRFAHVSAARRWNPSYKEVLCWPRNPYYPLGPTEIQEWEISFLRLVVPCCLLNKDIVAQGGIYFMIIMVIIKHKLHEVELPHYRCSSLRVQIITALWDFAKWQRPIKHYNQAFW